MGKHQLDLIKAAWALDVGHDAWMRGIHAATNALFSRWGAVSGTLLWDYSFDEAGRVELSSITHESPSVAAVDLSILEILAGNPEQAAMSQFYRSGPAFGSTDRQLSREPPAAREHILTAAAAYGCRDSYGYLAGDRSGGLAANSISGTVLELNERYRTVGLAIAAHLAGAYRLRRWLGGTRPDPDSAVAVLDTDGELLHQERPGADGLRDRLRAAATAQICVADGKARDVPVADAWRALVEGRYTLVDFHEARGRRLLLVYENPFHFATPRSLTKAQLDVVALASRSHTNRQIATALGTSVSTVANHLSAALGKLGLRRTELVRYLGWELEAAVDHGMIEELRVLSTNGRPGLRGHLTPAERSVAAMAVRGLSNREIAAARSSSRRTVANQLASVYEKLGVCSRSELAFVLTLDGDEDGEPAGSISTET